MGSDKTKESNRSKGCPLFHQVHTATAFVAIVLTSDRAEGALVVSHPDESEIEPLFERSNNNCLLIGLSRI